LHQLVEVILHLPQLAELDIAASKVRVRALVFLGKGIILFFEMDSRS
jgi:hypothetical protein